MKRTPFLVGLVSLLSLGCFGAGASAPQGLKLCLTRKSATPSARQILFREGGEPRWFSNKGWPFNGKNRAQRARIAAGFMHTR